MAASCSLKEVNVNFRSDINGLRAIAVIAVVLFHFNSELLSGGFAGVDVFFVISGFLMTSIVVKGLDTNKFNLISFYIARAKRIIPVLAIVCFSLLILGWFYLTPLDYALLGKHVLSSMMFFSNITYLNESGYFDASSLDKWLLHTWSLSVEWQFYLIYPALLLLLNRFFKLNSIRFIIVMATIASFIYCVVLTSIEPEKAFFLLPARAWEMLLGGVVFLYPIALSSKFKKVLQLTGISFIVISYLFLTESYSWPSYFAVLPALGTALVLWAHQNESIITNNYLFNIIGKSSYSIYLWHWPIVVLFNHLLFTSIEFQLIGIIFSFLLGWLSYLFIERKLVFANPTKNIKAILLYPPIASMLLIGGLGYFIYFDKGQAYRDSNVVAQKILRSPLAYECSSSFNDPDCKYFSDKTSWAVIGNSHAVELSYALALKLKNKDLGLKQYTAAGCAVSYQRTPITVCGTWNDLAVKEIMDNSSIDNVVISFRLTSSLFGDNIKTYPELPDERPVLSESLTKEQGRKRLMESFFTMINDVSRQKKKVYVVLPIPELSENINKTAFRENIFDEPIGSIKGTKLTYYHRRNSYVRDYLLEQTYNSNVIFVDPIDAYCDKVFCYATSKGIPLYFDDDHPSVLGAGLIIENMVLVN
jgi:peptidoglycan/LPS O-acetylase OafA/YrhL